MRVNDGHRVCHKCVGLITNNFFVYCYYSGWLSFIHYYSLCRKDQLSPAARHGFTWNTKQCWCIPRALVYVHQSITVRITLVLQCKQNVCLKKRTWVPSRNIRVPADSRPLINHPYQFKLKLKNIEQPFPCPLTLLKIINLSKGRPTNPR